MVTECFNIINLLHPFNYISCNKDSQGYVGSKIALFVLLFFFKLRALMIVTRKVINLKYIFYKLLHLIKAT